MLFEERQFVLERDRECVLAKRARALGERHQCRTAFGDPHRSDNLRLMSLEHVKERGKMAMSKKADDDRYHMVTMCYLANVAVPSRIVREWLRDYLEEVNR